MIQLYIASIEKLKDRELFDRKLLQVSAERRRKIEACAMEADKERSLAAGLLLEYAWRHYLKERGEKLEPFRIMEGEHGKPFCGNREDFCFNLSHSGEWVVCASAPEPVGVDIQQVKEVNLRVAQRFFLPEECEILKNSTDKNSLFCRMWTMKESYIKYTGQGMRQGINTFSVDVSTGVICDLQWKKQFYTERYARIPNYEIAVCTAQKQNMMVKKYDIMSISEPES